MKTFIHTSRRGFSLVELLVAVSIVGIITFIAVPKVSNVQAEAHKNLAISRAESLNMAVATLVQVRGNSAAATAWASASGDNAKYALIRPYLGFSEPTLTEYMPAGYTVEFPTTLIPMRKAILTGDGTAIDY
jgi:prepilin-type N-terminal cleavage/methylation domain-containing protein